MPIPDKLTAWFTAHQRILPFRENKDPYRIWVSEIMLQQTQVDTVLPYYNRFMVSFPTVFHLAEATEDLVFKHWEGLGYYSRAKNLLKCAQELVHQYDGRFPADYLSAVRLPGIGPYTAGAVLSIAYDHKIPAVDGNVMRVISRLYALNDDIASPKTRKLIEEKVQALIPENAGDFNQGLMELGALICTPQNPKCGQCPLAEECTANSIGLQNQLPVKTKKAPSQTLEAAAGLLQCSGRYLLIKNKEGLLSGLWGFPMAEGSSIISARDGLLRRVREDYGYFVERVEPCGTAKHVFSHKTWNITIYTVITTSVARDSETTFIETDGKNNVDMRWVKKEEIAGLAISSAFKKVLKHIDS